MKAHALVARNIRRLRVQRGLSQESLAADAEIDRAYMSRLERATDNPTLRVLEQITNALGVDIAELFVRPKPGEPAPRPLPGGRRPAVKRH
jgi:transcriptional regulator with XRE-family HTH domain